MREFEKDIYWPEILEQHKYVGDKDETADEQDPEGLVYGFVEVATKGVQEPAGEVLEVAEPEHHGCAVHVVDDFVARIRLDVPGLPDHQKVHDSDEHHLRYELPQDRSDNLRRE